jgi:CRP-like cAMP-binding protein
LDGKVCIVKNDKEIRVIYRSGDIFGEMGIIDGSARSASVYAIDETLCLSTDVSYIDRLSGNNKTAMAYILYKVFAEFLASVHPEMPLFPPPRWED